jgi:hypothetical protein
LNSKNVDTNIVRKTANEIDAILDVFSIPKIEMIMGIFATDGIFLKKLIIGRNATSNISISEIIIENMIAKRVPKTNPIERVNKLGKRNCWHQFRSMVLII